MMSFETALVKRSGGSLQKRKGTGILMRIKDSFGAFGWASRVILYPDLLLEVFAICWQQHKGSDRTRPKVSTVLPGATRNALSARPLSALVCFM